MVVAVVVVVVKIPDVIDDLFEVFVFRNEIRICLVVVNRMGIRFGPPRWFLAAVAAAAAAVTRCSMVTVLNLVEEIGLSHVLSHENAEKFLHHLRND